MQKPSLPRGTRDFGPQISSKRKFITDTIERHFGIYGFNKIETPAVENLSVLTGKYGDEGDQLLFKVLNSGDFLKKSSDSDYRGGSKVLLPKIAEKGLRYDLTVPFARYVVMNQNDTVMPFKRYQMQPVWRADRPARGRYREFYQCDADIIGTRSLWCEVELTILIHEVLTSLGINDFELKVNHRGVLFAMADHVGMKGHEVSFCTELDKLNKIGTDAVRENLVNAGADQDRLGVVLEKITEQGSAIGKLDQTSEFIGSDNEGIDQLNKYVGILEELDSMGNTVIDLSLARGLTYYTGIIFEVKPKGIQMGSICGGGRYDDLTGTFGLPDVSGVGISFGLDRIYDVMDELGLFPERNGSLKVLITHLDEGSFAAGQRILVGLRKAGIPADIYPELTKLKKQMSYANKTGVPFVITIGEEEMNTGILSLKNMNDGNQMHLSVSQITEYLIQKD